MTAGLTIWIDAQFSPAIATWIQQNFPVTALALRELGLRDAEDKEIFTAARDASAVVMTKDSGFLGNMIWVCSKRVGGRGTRWAGTNRQIQRYSLPAHLMPVLNPINQF